MTGRPSAPSVAMYLLASWYAFEREKPSNSPASSTRIVGTTLGSGTVLYRLLMVPSVRYCPGVAQRKTAKSSGPTVLVPAEIVGTVSPGVAARAEYTTDDEHSFLRLTRLVIEVEDWNSDIGITSATLHAVKLGALGRGAENVLAMRADYKAPRPPTHGRKPGRPRDTWTERELARLAREYAKLAKRPGKVDIYGVLAETWRTPSGETVSVSALRTAVKLARSSGFLTETTPGVGGGEVTDDAKKLLRGGKG